MEGSEPGNETNAGPPGDRLEWVFSEPETLDPPARPRRTLGAREALFLHALARFNLLGAALQVLSLLASLWAFVNMVSRGFAVREPAMIVFCLKRFVAIPAVALLHCKLAFGLEQRRPWALRVQGLFSGAIAIFLLLAFLFPGSSGLSVRSVTGILAVGAVQALILIELTSPEVAWLFSPESATLAAGDFRLPPALKPLHWVVLIAAAVFTESAAQQMVSWLVHLAARAVQRHVG